jgi:glycosyltransferase involved in cell wall biosynthesis
MAMDKILTIVIPTYNMEKYLDKCLTSLIVGDFELMRRLEVLVVIDGAKDRSSEIAHSYENKYPDTFRVIDKENGNYGSCINRGLKEATGKYIKVLDADDWFDSKVFQSFLEFLTDVDCDMILSSFNRVDECSTIVETTKWDIHDGNTFGLESIPLINIEMHAITYKTSILKNMGYRQTEGISYTDTEWSVLPLPYITNCVTFTQPLYQYLVGRDGQTVHPAAFAKNYHQRVKICYRLMDELSSLSSGNQAYKYLRFKLWSYISNDIYRQVLANSNSIDLSDLMRLDGYIKTKDIDYYNMLESLILSRKYPIHFVKRWRSYNYKSKGLLVKIYFLLTKLKKVIAKI